MRNIKILFPNTCTKIHNGLYFRGSVDHSDVEIVIYITEFSTNFKALNEKKTKRNDIIAFYDTAFSFSTVSRKLRNVIVLDQSINLNIQKLVIENQEMDISQSIVLIYNYEGILHSEVKWEFDDTLCKLQSLVTYKDNQFSNYTDSKPLIHGPHWLKCSMLLQHIINYVNIVNWSSSVFKIDKKISIKLGNMMLSIIVDLLCGYLVLAFITHDKKELGTFLMGILESLISMLYSLLKWLMGAPAGLKLNNAFNKMLGKYFSYHVQLWWLFFDVAGEKLTLILNVYYYLGYLGLTFQAAVLSDLICIATFHAYCIYVYAARMFNMQISGLKALLRFFVGRKYNPLRQCIDSCEYTNQELFVGTVAFTILLLLLPTTAMYYTVFTMFRLVSLLVQYALAKAIYLIHTLPLYVVGLWLVRSPKVTGNVLLEVIDSEETSDKPLYIKLRLISKSLYYLINNFYPPVTVPKQLEWGTILSNVFNGKHII